MTWIPHHLWSRNLGFTYRILVLPIDERTLSPFNCQYWADRRHASAITLGARGLATDYGLFLPLFPRMKGAAHNHPDGARTTLLASTPTAASDHRPVTTAAPPGYLEHVYHTATADGLELLNYRQLPIQIRWSFQAPPTLVTRG